MSQASEISGGASSAAMIGLNQATQVLLTLRYQERWHQGLPLPKFADVEFSCFSQAGEDGILLYLFSLLGFTNRRTVEICAGDGIYCNTSNLIIHHGAQGLLFDGSAENIEAGQAFYAECPATCIAPDWQPTLVQAWITRDNINSLITDQGFVGEIDLLSLDLDGVDYWIWQALDCIQPRVVVLEYQAGWPADKAVTVPYRDDFALDFNRQPWFCGASLAAFVKLGREKGYRYVGSHRRKYNAFFVQSGLGEDIFPEVPIEEGLVEGYDLSDVDWEERQWVEV